MIEGIMLVWFAQVALAVAFVAWDIRRGPQPTVMKWGFVLLTAYTGPVGAFLYVLGCREPFPGTHEKFVAAHWRQTLGSTMHCVAGDGVGILVGAAIGGLLGVRGGADVVLEYVLGFGFGWSIFQSLFMRSMSGSYLRALRATFLAEFLSMNCLMAAMLAAAAALRMKLPGADAPASPRFWFVLSLALLAGFIVAVPINSWMVRRGLKHGMLTRPDAMPPHAAGRHAAMAMPERPTAAALAGATAVSLAVLAAGLALTALLGGLR